MGIKSLNIALKKIDATIFKEMPIQNLEGKRVAVDLSIYINTFAMSSQEFWFNLMTNFLLNLIKWKIEPIIVLDGLHVPSEKLDERDKRKSSQQKNQVRLEKLTHFRDKILLTCFDGDEPKLVPEDIQDELTKICRIGKSENLNLRDADEVLLYVTTKLTKAEQSAEGITSRHKSMARELIKAMGLKYIQADGEAEALCASLAYQGHVDAVLSRDTDNLVYGCPMLITNIEKGLVSYVGIDDILKAMDFTMKQFIDYCICLGSDYNSNIPKCGPAAVLKALRQYGSIDKWKEAKPELQFHVLKYKRCREIFRPFSKSYLDRCKIMSRPFDAKKLDELFAEVSSRYTGEYVLGCLQGKTVPVFLKKESNILGDMEE